MDLSEFELTRLHLDKNILPFDCGDTDLNEFLLADSKRFTTELLAVTYILEAKENTAAFFCVFNDKISVQDVGSNNKWNRFKSLMPKGKHFKSYPAVKIGRLGVTKDFKGKRIGTAILDYIKYWFINNNKTGCRFITVDAYKASLDFYSKNQFNFLTESDKDEDTRLMYFDLASLV